MAEIYKVFQKRRRVPESFFKSLVCNSEIFLIDDENSYNFLCFNAFVYIFENMASFQRCDPQYLEIPFLICKYFGEIFSKNAKNFKIYNEIA